MNPNRQLVAPLACALCAWVTAGCGAGGAPADAFVLRDSPGIAVAENRADTAALPR